ncbi:MAG: CopD family protein [Flavobacteriales bacterium]|nr:CopD family protein [Flavobacteriales bacterium]MCB9449672.1 CopD family protein [Flavobacteriales bacterium]
MAWQYIKALHIIFIVTWFAGLFYIVRLFVYHAESALKPDPEKGILQKQFKLMEKRLWYGIAWPSMVITMVLGPWLAITLYPTWDAWLLVKLALVLGLVLYHLQCHSLFTKFQADMIPWKSYQLRIWNELATVLLVAIVFIVVFKNLFDFWWGLLGLVVFSMLLMLAIRVYRKRREKRNP